LLRRVSGQAPSPNPPTWPEPCTLIDLRRRCARHPALHFDRAAHRVGDAAELDDRAIAGSLDDPPAMDRDHRVDEVAAQPPKTRKRPLLIGLARRE
jgi:hypothetical protein